MKRNTGEKIQNKALVAITELTSMLATLENDNASKADIESFKKPIGIIIGKIQMDIFEKIYVEHPDLDDLK